MSILKSPIVQLCLVGAFAFGLWRVTGVANARLAQIPVKAPPAAGAIAPSTDTRRIYPATALQPAPVSASGAADVDAVFGVQPDQTDELEPPPPDYSAMFQQQVVLQGVASNGAFLNGQFYVVGQPMPRLAIPRADGSMLTPVLDRVGTEMVTISADGAPVAIHPRQTL